ncbi:MAG: hypothetical protein JWP72_320 [Massilia sp.]|nr:hypothetical protein [Massilia sp.]
MRAVLLACLIVAPVAQAQVIECPKFYPWQDTVLAEVPHGHKGKGLVRKGQLMDATLNEGEFNQRSFGELQGGRKNLKNGWEVDYPSFPGPKWFVCFYEPGNVTWWEQLDNKPLSCKLKVVKKNSKGMMDAALTCK